MKRWFRFAFRSEDPDGPAGAATQVEEPASSESDGGAIPEAELSPEDSFVEQTLEPTTAADTPRLEPESVGDALNKLFPGVRDFGAGTHNIENAGVEMRHDWEPIL